MEEGGERAMAFSDEQVDRIALAALQATNAGVTYNLREAISTLVDALDYPRGYLGFVSPEQREAFCGRVLIRAQAHAGEYPLCTWQW